MCVCVTKARAKRVFKLLIIQSICFNLHYYTSSNGMYQYVGQTSQK